MLVCRFHQCENRQFCGPLWLKEVRLKSGGRDTAIETRYCTGIQDEGRLLAAQVQVGTMVGSECTNEHEPHIISCALTAESTWEGESSSSWMGAITAGCYQASMVCIMSRVVLLMLECRGLLANCID